MSPTIHPGPLLGPVKTKMAPRHWLLETWATLKSSGEMDHVCSPKEIATLTVVEQAVDRNNRICSIHDYSRTAEDVREIWANLKSPGEMAHVLPVE
jgi:hypothetical protein